MGRTEHEAKLPVPDLAPVRARLLAADAELLRTGDQVDTLYDFPDGRLTGQDAALRLRRTNAGVVLTYKGPPQPGAFKLRDEYESGLEDGEAVALALDALGFVITLSYSKKREAWRLGGCDVCLDTVPHLGTFVEIEGPAVAAISDVATTLGLDPATHEDRSYVHMLAEYCEQHALDPRSLHE